MQGAMIRQATVADAGALYSLVNSNLDDYFAPEVIEFFLMQWPRGQLIATDLFGNCQGALCGSLLDGGRASVSLFAVDGPCRGSGLGSQLLEQFRLRCLMEGVSTIQLEVRTNNAGAISFYKRHGFAVTENLPCYYNDGGDGFRMVSPVRRPS